MGFLLHADGRWNRFGEYGCLYTALSRKGAIAEFEKVLRQVGLKAAEYREIDLVTIQADLAKVLDLTDHVLLRGKGLTTHMITADTGASFDLCRLIADSARAGGFTAILSPSAAANGEKNLNIYVDGRAGDLNLEVGNVREPLNY